MAVTHLVGSSRQPAVATIQEAVRDGSVGPSVALTRDRSLGRLIGAGLAGFALILLVIRVDRRGRIDLAVSRAIQRWRGPRIERAMVLASWPGFPPQSRLIPIGIIGGWLMAGAPAEAVFQALAGGSAVIATGLKAITRRQRPGPPQVNVVMAKVGGTSFPSGHVLAYVGTYGFLAYLLSVRVRDGRIRAFLMAPPIALVAGVGPSRIHQGHHWLTDVLASYMLGLSYVAALAALYRRWLVGKKAR